VIPTHVSVNNVSADSVMTSCDTSTSRLRQLDVTVIQQTSSDDSLAPNKYIFCRQSGRNVGNVSGRVACAMYFYKVSFNRLVHKHFSDSCLL